MLQVFIEFPAALPPTTPAAAAAAAAAEAAETAPTLPVAQTVWERAVVTSDAFGAALPRLALLHPHKYVDHALLPAAWLPQSDIVIAKVCGYASATCGLPPPNATYPLLVRASGTLLVAATQLSRARARRFAPSAAWMVVVDRILAFASGTATGSLPQPLWSPSVTASYNASEALPPDAEKNALWRGVQFYRRALLMPDAQRAGALSKLNCDQGAGSSDACEAFARLANNTSGSGDGQLGVLEGLTSDIAIDGTQPQSIGMRGDCVTETSASFAIRGVLTQNASDRQVAKNLLNYGHIHSGFHQPWAVGGGSGLKSSRPWVPDGSGFGLMAWTTNDAAYKLFYKASRAPQTRPFPGLLAARGPLHPVARFECANAASMHHRHRRLLVLVVLVVCC